MVVAEPSAGPSSDSRGGCGGEAEGGDTGEVADEAHRWLSPPFLPPEMAFAVETAMKSARETQAGREGTRRDGRRAAAAAPSALLSSSTDRRVKIAA